MKNTINNTIGATIRQGILGGFSGRIGNVVGSSWKGRAVIKARPLHVHDPKTAKQLLSRARFAMVQKLLSLIGASTAAAGFKSKSRSITEANYFVRTNYDAITGSELDNLSVDYSLVSVAEGKLPGLELRGAISSDDPATVHVAWNDNSSLELASAADTVRFVAVNPEAGASMLFTSSRSELSADLVVPTAWQGQAVHLYAFVISVSAANNNLVSDSVYAGKVTVA
ncbi:MAG: DUF6266 family protein [Bacteroidales bacterium]|nr:DUF6266 family protein [Bacteroidales bacterium]